MAVVRTNNMDGLLVFVLLCSLYLAVEAWRTGSLWYLTGAAVLIGIGFNMKMIQAFVVIPACFAIYLLNGQISWRKKILHICAASAVLLVVSASWAVMMDLTPADQRPYIGSSQENSVFNLISGYNGLNRIFGGFNPSGMKSAAGNDSFPGPFPGGFGASLPPGLGSDPAGSPPPFGDNMTPGVSPPGNGDDRRPGGMSGFNDGGEPGLFRMGDAGMSGQISWMLPFALIGLLAWLSRPSRLILRNMSERAILTVALVLWLVPELVYFSFTNGFYHTYYVVMVAIPLAGLVGIGAVSMYERYAGSDNRGWLLIGAILVTGLVQWQFLKYNAGFSGVLPWIILIGSIISALLLTAFRVRALSVQPRVRDSIVVLAICLLSVSPFIWACTPVIYQGNAALPFAGPDLISGNGSSTGMNRGMEGVNSSNLYSYLSSYVSGEKYLLGVESAMSSSDLIVTYGTSVMAMGGFSGSDAILTIDSLKVLIGSGEIRFFLFGQDSRGMPGRESSNVTTWIKDNCPVIPESEWNLQNQSNGPKSNLYDCKGVV